MDDRALLRDIADLVAAEATDDDCAVLLLNGSFLVATTDMLHQSTDFPPGMTDFQAGWMAAAASLSDIAAMGARPWGLLIAVGLDLPHRLRPVLEGAVACGKSVECPIIGGDIDSHQELTIVTTGIGSVEKEYLVRRRGSQPGDLICVTSILGRAQAALEGYIQYRRFLFEPRPRVREGQQIGRAGATSMMDLSDGLALSLHDLLRVNNAGYTIESRRLPIISDIPEHKAQELALYGGGDYELLFTIPPDRVTELTIDHHIIGTVIQDHTVLLDGVPLEARGYRHTWQVTND
ncbi:MAG: thiamine-phosphate kinase [Methanomicrobiales archaeon]|nr:thiamine-phosphate kinase [Methanomicrobiales archaeon]